MSALSAPAALSTGVAFFGGARPLRAKHTAAPARARNGAVTTRAFLGGLFSGGGPKQPVGVAMVCRDCGYIYRKPDFNDLPKDYKCPPCGSGKSAFRPEKAMDLKKDGFNVPGIRQKKKANKAEFEAKRAAKRKAAEDAAKRR